MSRIAPCGIGHLVQGVRYPCTLLAGHASDHLDTSGLSWIQCDAFYTAPSDFKFRCKLELGHAGQHESFIDGSGVRWDDMPKFDEVNPKHYNSHPSGIECIVIAEWHNFNVGCVLKYLWRAGLKGPDIDVTTCGDSEKRYVQGTTPSSGLTDLRKARWYLDREISRLEGTHVK